jgi:septum formation protein
VARLILGSSSPRRKALLAQLAIPFEVVPAHLDETQLPSEPAAAYVERLAKSKAQAVREQHPDAMVLAADTTVVLEGRILGKPANEEEARQMLSDLSGQTHTVISGVALFGSELAHRVVRTRVHFRQLTEKEIRWYVGTGEPMDKAGAYAIQGAGGFFVRGIDGSASNVVGLPLAETLELLTEAGFPLPWSVAP